MKTRRKSSDSLLRFGAIALLLEAAASVLAPSMATGQEPAGAPPCAFSSTTPLQLAVIRIVDQSGALLPRAAIEVRCGNSLFNGIADERGEAKFQLRAGRYTVLTRMPGFADTVLTTNLPSTSEPLNVAMSVGSATDVINVTADTGFVPYASNAGSKTNALLIEVPQSISIVNEAEMNARQVVTMNEALRYTPGVQADQYGFEPRFDWLEIRGFPAQTFGIYRDGMRFNSLSGKLDPFELESVEVLKGPSSVLYGEAPPGGLINQVTKRPEAERATTVAGQFGSFDRHQGDFDTTGSFDRNEVWRYRLLGLLRDAGTQVNFTPDNRRLIAPAIEWHPSDRTNLTVLADYQHDHTKWDQFLPAEGTLFPNPNGVISRSLFLGEPSYDNVARNQGSFAYTADHLFEDGWDVHSNYRYQYIDFKGQTIAGNGFVAGSTTEVSRYLFATPNTNRINTVDTRALRRFGTGSTVEQTVLFGYDYQRLDQRATSYYLFGVGDLNVYNPVYGQTAIPAGAPYLNNDSVLNQHGLYAQDQLKFKHRLVLTVGGRQDFAQNTLADFISTSGNYSRLDDKFTGRVGLTYLFDSGLAPYFAFSTSFLPNAGTYVYDPATGLADKPAVPSDAREVEGGVKFQPRNWNGFITASLFQINETNVLVPNTSYTDYQTGAVRSRGIELEGVASITHGLNLHAGYTLTEAIDTQDVQLQNNGRWLPQTPRNQVSALLDYTLQHGHLAGLGGNFGVRFVGENAADSANSFFVPKYTLLDAGLRFGYWHTLFSVNATNLADKRYVATCISTAACYYGFERNVIGTAQWRF